MSRAKLYYLRDRVGKAVRLKERNQICVNLRVDGISVIDFFYAPVGRIRHTFGSMRVGRERVGKSSE